MFFFLILSPIEIDATSTRGYFPCLMAVTFLSHTYMHTKCTLTDTHSKICNLKPNQVLLIVCQASSSRITFSDLAPATRPAFYTCFCCSHHGITKKQCFSPLFSVFSKISLYSYFTRKHPLHFLTHLRKSLFWNSEKNTLPLDSSLRRH